MENQTENDWKLGSVVDVMGVGCPELKGTIVGVSKIVCIRAALCWETVISLFQPLLVAWPLIVREAGKAFFVSTQV